MVGGECIGWERDGCYIDGCIHWLTGTKEGNELNRLWKSVGALENTHIMRPPYLYTYRYGNKEITVYRDIEKFKQSMLDVAPEDTAIISIFIHYLIGMKAMQMPVNKPMDMMNIFDFIKLGKAMGKAGKLSGKLSKISICEFANKCQNPCLKQFFLSYMPKDYSIMSLVVTFATFISGNGDIPTIKSKDFSENIKRKYLELGGKIEYKKTVQTLKIEDEMVKAAICNDGSQYEADYFIPATDIDVTYHKLLNSNYNDKKFEQRYQDQKTNPLIANCYFAYAVQQDEANKLPEMLMLECSPFAVANKSVTLIGLKKYSYFDNGNGMTTLISPLLQDGEDYEFWKKLYSNRSAYKKEKLRVATEILQRFIELYPSLNGKIKIIDCATPVTYERYVGAYKGAYMAFMLTFKSKQLMHSGRVKGIKNLFLASQWQITPGGLPSALVSGKFAVQRICKRDKKQCTI